MKGKFNLTNEAIRGKFQSNFELVNYAISLAENMVRTGRAPRVHIEIENPAVQVVEEILTGRDRFDMLEMILQMSDSDGDNEDQKEEEQPKVSSQPKKGRKESAKK